MISLSVRIISVTNNSPAEHAGILPEERIVSINHEPILDEIDYQALSSQRNLNIIIENSDGVRKLNIHKDEWEPLGLCLDETETMKPRHCKNHCVFCFIDQMPPGMRESLYVKDDDWRLSLMMGNYITLTNINDSEFKRILSRKASPLYISVHATDPDVRCRMLRNPHAGRLLDQLKELKAHNLQFHCQIVLCPGINDGAVLKKTIDDLANLYPEARSVAIVPVGLTTHRESLAPLTPFNADTSRTLLEEVHEYQKHFLKTIGTRFVFPSDEFYCLCHEPLPEEAEYEDYPQIENGVGMIRQLEQECELYWKELIQEKITVPEPKKKLIPTGVSAQPHIQHLAEKYKPEGTCIQVIAVPNKFFGESITVTGLIVGKDLIDAVNQIDCDEILLCDSMLREKTDRFLDDTTLEEVRSRLHKPIRIVHNNGESLIRALWGMEEADV